MNEDVFKMISTLHARLDDVHGAVEKLDREAPEFASKLDKIDDKLYLLQCEIEKLSTTDAPVGESDTAQAEESSTVDPASDESAPKAADSEPEGVSDEGETTIKSKASDEDENSDKKKEIFSDDMKENLADAGRAIGNIYRDGKEVITELSGTMGDLKDIFSFGKKR